MNSKIEEIIEKFDEIANLWILDDDDEETMNIIKDFLKSSLIEYEDEVRKEEREASYFIGEGAVKIAIAMEQERVRKYLLEKVEGFDGIVLNHTPLGNGKYIKLEDVKNLLK